MYLQRVSFPAKHNKLLANIHTASSKYQKQITCCHSPRRMISVWFVDGAWAIWYVSVINSMFFTPEVAAEFGDEIPIWIYPIRKIRKSSALQ